MADNEKKKNAAKAVQPNGVRDQSAVCSRIV
jgi:hypothetical protein